jgi:hypothetical protein
MALEAVTIYNFSLFFARNHWVLLNCIILAGDVLPIKPYFTLIEDNVSSIEGA